MAAAADVAGDGLLVRGAYTAVRALANQRRPVNRSQKAVPVAVPAPVGGWNTRDSLDAMDPTDAVILDNWFPGLGSCSIRGGTASYATGLGAAVKMLAEFNAGSLRKFIAGANGRIWDISSAGAGVSLASGFASDVWNWAQFDDSSGGPRMGLVNGSNAPQIYDGATVGPMTISGVGLTPANLNGIHIHKNRSYFWDDRTQDFWYSATNALGGALTKFPLGRLQGTGGNMLAMGTYAMDSAGEGPQDYAVFLLTSGDVLMYAGSDPGSATDWQLRGRYNIGAPISKRAVKKVGAELMMVTKAGYVPLSNMLASGRLNEQAASGKIRGAALAAVAAYGTQFGWEVFHYPRKNQLIVNAPVSATQIVQHVMNTETQAWCRFTGINAQCWGMYNDLPYFGKADGTVWLYDTGYGDGSATINADGQPAWNYLDDRRVEKRATMIRPLLRTTGGAVTYNVAVGFDFQLLTTSFDVSAPTITSSLWDVSMWDVALWADDGITSGIWSSVVGMGYAIGVRLRIFTATQGVDWLSTTFVVEDGGIL